MPSKCTSFGQQQDNLGQPFNFAFRGFSRHGTALGGYITLTVRIFIWTIALMEIWFCFTKPATTQYTSWSQLSVPNEQFYNISTTEGFPSVQIYSPKTGLYNDENLFDFYWQMESFNGTQNVTAILCSEYVTKYITDQFTQEQVLKQFLNLGNQFVCPDLEHFELREQAWVHSTYNHTQLRLIIDKNEAADYTNITGTSVFGQWVFPYYSAADYLSND